MFFYIYVKWFSCFPSIFQLIFFVLYISVVFVTNKSLYIHLIVLGIMHVPCHYPREPSRGEGVDGGEKALAGRGLASTTQGG